MQTTALLNVFLLLPMQTSTVSISKDSSAGLWKDWCNGFHPVLYSVMHEHPSLWKLTGNKKIQHSFSTEKWRGLLCTDMCHPTEHTDRPMVLANHPWQKAPLTLEFTGTMWSSSTACHRFSLASADSRNVSQWQQELQLQEPGNLPVKNMHSRRSITSAFSVVNTSKLSGNYSPEPSIKSISEEQILNIN